MLAGASAAEGETPPVEPLWHATGTLLLPSLALARIEAGDVSGALELATRLVGAAGACVPPVHMMTKMIRQFGKVRSYAGVIACLDAQAAAGQQLDAECLQVISDAMVRSVRFVKGGVSMDTLPYDDYPEVAFVGRSNVGKSSLVNMVLGRRALAYASKTPGKTQQYNYFILNEGSGGTGRTRG